MFISLRCPCRAEANELKCVRAFLPQLDLQMREVSGDVQVAWTLSNLEVWDLQLTPSCAQVRPKAAASTAFSADRIGISVQPDAFSAL